MQPESAMRLSGPSLPPSIGRMRRTALRSRSESPSLPFTRLLNCVHCGTPPRIWCVEAFTPQKAVGPRSAVPL